ncbi:HYPOTHETICAL PROTEIN MCJ_003330 [Mesomycoplasma conjunctivae]|uniref:Uncharacterized protein n=1 Tax=Mesomycoplasma conjunctivae (strain ATCC 25834 / NCTC 10147 / HRC/581) TaxID=572263 RepID=C5J6D2_MESCH|nr:HYPOTHETICAL PROTEIN MCJ_003330 [Mesomycoplasma conjunctivae]
MLSIFSSNLVSQLNKRKYKKQTILNNLLFILIFFNQLR